MGSGTDPAHSAGILLKTTDRGETWQPLAWPHGGIATLSFADARTGVAVAYDGQVYATADGGSTWQPTGRAPDAGGSLGVFPSPREGFLPGAGLYHTRDGGVSWHTERASPDQDYFSALGFSPAGAGIAATSNGLIFLRQP